jgi:hypothetical protein
MAKPAEKSQQVDDLINEVFGGNRKSSVRANICVSAPTGCGLPADKFTDALSAKEYTISGLCQTCQDKIFG